MYREFGPPAAVRAAIACFWIRRGDGSAVRVLPDTCVDIIWRAGQGAVVAGPDTTAWLSQTRPGELIVGARLLPGAGGAALGLPLTELRNQRAPLPDAPLIARTYGWIVPVAPRTIHDWQLAQLDTRLGRAQETLERLLKPFGLRIVLAELKHRRRNGAA